MSYELFDENGVPLLMPGVDAIDSPPRSVLPKTRAKTGMVTNTVNPPPVAPPAAPQGGGGGLPLATGQAGFGAPGYEAQAFSRSDELRNKAFDALQPDEEAMGRGRRESMMGTMAGMAMQAMGSEGMREAGGSLLRQAMAQQAKYEADPFKQAEIKSRRLMSDADMWDKRAAASVSHADRVDARKMADETRKQALAIQAMVAQATLGMRQQGLDMQREKLDLKAQEGAKTAEGEKAAAGYLGRMRAAEALLEKIPGGRPSLFTTVVGSTETGKSLRPYVEGVPQQKYRQAQEDWVRAKLRKESGAVIGAQEMADEIRTYFPQPGEGDQIAAQKRQSRLQADAQLGTMAGKAPVPGVASGGFSEAEYNALPSGATYTAPDGTQRRKQ